MQDGVTKDTEGMSADGVPRDEIYVVGLDLGGTNIRLLVSDSTGRSLGRMKRPLRMGSTPDQIVATTRTYIEELFAQANLPLSQLKALAAGIPGITNVNTGIVKAAPFLSDWKNVPLRSMLEEQMHLPVFLENDVNLAAYGEAASGIAQNVRDFIFLAIGTGFGAGIVLRGELYQGADWASGEVGYLQVCGACDLPQGQNGAGALESLIGGPAIERAWQKAAAGSGQSMHLSATDIFDLASTGVPLAERLLEQTASLLSNAILNISLVLNCPLFVLGGGVGSSEVLKKRVVERLRLSRNLVNPRIETSALGQDAQLIGAMHLALKKWNAR